MKEIKTVQYRCDLYEAFDKEVNDLIKEGWTLKNRIVLPASEGE